MEDKKIKKLTETERLLSDKRRRYMREYYLRTKKGKTNTKNKKIKNSEIKIKRGNFLVTFD
tara:strand:+ start:266 stop:448 length:183 start_codon:yes stop_codon:yes gene_type:complete